MSRRKTKKAASENQEKNSLVDQFLPIEPSLGLKKVKPATKAERRRLDARLDAIFSTRKRRRKRVVIKVLPSDSEPIGPRTTKSSYAWRERERSVWRVRPLTGYDSGDFVNVGQSGLYTHEPVLTLPGKERWGVYKRRERGKRLYLIEEFKSCCAGNDEDTRSRYCGRKRCANCFVREAALPDGWVFEIRFIGMKYNRAFKDAAGIDPTGKVNPSGKAMDPDTRKAFKLTTRKLDGSR